jgi:hypothetical protein
VGPLNGGPVARDGKKAAAELYRNIEHMLCPVLYTDQVLAGCVRNRIPFLNTWKRRLQAVAAVQY